MESPFEISPEAFDCAMASFAEIAHDEYDCGEDDSDWDGFADLDVDDGQPTEYDEWQSFDPDC